jgi:futalosine hydrolase
MKPLVLIPTDFERKQLQPLIAEATTLELCGFGVAAAAARTSSLIASHKPKSVLLAGIAGSYRDTLSIGAAYTFASVACYGIGVGTGAAFQTANQMGWPHWAGCDQAPEIGDCIALQCDAPDADQLLTVCAGASDEEDVRLRQNLFPDALAEDMEGFGVAVACELAGVPLQILRGISNVAGNRNHKAWQIQPALSAVAIRLNEILDR